jgi:para-aminobenzoate synthetase component I
VKSIPLILIKKTDESGYLIGIGKKKSLEFNQEVDFNLVDDFINNQKGDFIFSTLSYDVKNQIEKLESKKEDRVLFPLASFWTAELVMELNENGSHIISGELNPEFKLILEEIQQKSTRPKPIFPVKFKSKIAKDTYLKNVELIKREIQLGNVYELNYCQEFYAENYDHLDSFSLLFLLFDLTQAPFSCYVNNGTHELFCGSPERFLLKEGVKLYSQPIKGTIKRGATKVEDEILKKQLKEDPKENAENIMITDLVRNDLAKIASKNSVNVNELCGLYSFGTVHQLISTISCKLKDETTFSSILKATFPMGSMTGAPKFSAMQLIERFEAFKRGIYSGSVGYINPTGDFDFNVVIRALVYNKKTHYLSCAVGGAITIQSDSEKEYEECLTKIKRLIQLFGNDQFD